MEGSEVVLNNGDVESVGVLGTVEFQDADGWVLGVEGDGDCVEVWWCWHCGEGADVKTGEWMCLVCEGRR